MRIRSITDFFKCQVPRPATKSEDLNESQSTSPQSMTPLADCVTPPGHPINNRESDREAKANHVATDDVPSSSLTSLPTSTISQPGDLPTPTHSDNGVCNTNAPIYIPSSSSLTLTPPPRSPISQPVSPSAPRTATGLSLPISTHITRPHAQDLDHTKISSHGSSSLEAPLTQASTIRSSQRVSKNGDVYIANSDGDSDESLEDIDDIINRQRPPLHEPVPYKSSLGHEGRSADTSPPSRKRKAVSSSFTARKAPRVSLQTLAEKCKHYEESKEAIATANAVFKSSTNDASIQRGSVVDGLAMVMERVGDDENGDRIKLAIMRTGALDERETWSFFANKQQPDKASGFPPLDNFELNPIKSKPAVRQQAFISGFLGDYASANALPGDLLDWLLDTACMESRDDLRRSYIDVLRQVAETSNGLTDVDRLESLLRRLGTEESAICVDSPLEPEPASPVEALASDLLSRISRLLDVLLALVNSFDRPTTIFATCIVCRMLCDSSISSSALLQHQIESVFANLLEHLLHSKKARETEPQTTFPGLIQSESVGLSEQGQSQISSEVVTPLFKSTSHPELRILLLKSLPFTTLPCAYLRQQLALSWFFDKTPPRYGHSIPLAKFTKRLSKPSFRSSHLTTYISFTAFIHLLDVAIDACSDQPPPTPDMCSRDDLKRHKAKEEIFNESIDNLVVKLKIKFNSIKGDGASDLRRIEAKETLEGLSLRLLHGIRTTAPAKPRLFEEENLSSEKKGMEGFMSAIRKTDTTVNEQVQGEEKKEDFGHDSVAKPRLSRNIWKGKKPTE